MGQAADLPRPPPQIPDHELLRPIGRGAYGQVWLARNVMGTLRAVKVVYRQDFGEPQPFEREFKGIQKFEPVSRSHDGLIDILQIGRNESEGYFYYVMELADSAGQERSTGVLECWSDGSPANAGSQQLQPSNPPVPHYSTTPTLHHPNSYIPHTLRHDLRSRGRLPFEECLRLGLSLTSALQHLDQHGLVHRDIKPSNIIFVGSKPKLADIGLVTNIDEAHSLVGTVGYIPPDGAGTPQADLYSLGKVLYEAAFGKQAAEFPQLPADLPSRPEHRRLLELNEIIARACASRPEDRYHSAAEMQADLVLLERGRSVRTRRALEQAGRLAMRTTPMALAVAVLGIVFFNLSLKKRGPAALPAERASVFVLPFRPTWPVGLDGNPIGENFFDDKSHSRITDAVIDSLALLKGVRVGPRKSGWTFRDETERRREAAKTFAYVLDGKLTNPPGRLELQATLFQGRPERSLWSQTFTATTNDVIGLERQVIDRVARSLGIQATPEEARRIDQILTNNLAAYREWRAAIGLVVTSWSWTNLTTVKVGLSQAERLDPNFVEALLGISMLDIETAGGEAPPRDRIPRAMNLCRKVLEIDDTCFQAMQRLVSWRLLYDWDWAGATDEFDRLRQLYPDEHLIWAIMYRCLGRTNEARLELAKAEKQDPNNWLLRGNSAAARFSERDYAGALKEANRWPQLTYENYPILARCYVETADYAKALDLIGKGQAVYNNSEWEGLLGRTYALMGEREKALEVLRKLEEGSRTGYPYVQPYCVAWVHAGLGQNDQALEWLDRAVQERNPYPVHAHWGGLRTDPAWDGLRDDPRFLALLKTVGLDVWPR
ncbi:MAG TPA: protein kinase [Verrucomicrobiae bacterium]